ncbi:hypothetical protein ACFX1X_021074 [Malus domestica]
MGEKCQPPEFSGVIYCDECGIQLSELPPRLYLKYLRNVAEKTGIGRFAGSSVLRLVNEAMSISSSTPHLNGKMSAEIWDSLEQVLKVIFIPTSCDYSLSIQ